MPGPRWGLLWLQPTASSAPALAPAQRRLSPAAAPPGERHAADAVRQRDADAAALRQGVSAAATAHGQRQRLGLASTCFSKEGSPGFGNKILTRNRTGFA